MAVDLSRSLGKRFPVFRLFLSYIRHVGGDVDQANDGWVISCFRDYGTTIAMSNKKARSVLQSYNAFGGGDVILEGRFRLLNHAYIEMVLNKNVINLFPARAICPGAVYEYDVLDRNALRKGGDSGESGNNCN